MAAKQAGLSLGGQVFFGSLCAGTFGLGVWQTQRYYEKVQLVAERQRDLAMEPAPYQELVGRQQQGWRRIRVQGRFDHDREFLVGPRGPPPGYQLATSGGMSSSPQGYFVVTPLTVLQEEEPNQTVEKSGWWWWGKQQRQTSMDDKSSSSRNKKSRILVNRGWVPRQLVVGGRSRHSTANASLAWDRPSKVVQLTVVPTQPEQPKSFLVPQHDLQQHPPRLFWYDLSAMLVAAGLDDDNKTSPLVTAVRNASDPTTWPVPPTADNVGDFSVHPATHVGYAATWYGLSAAGLYMTRRLLRR